MSGFAGQSFANQTFRRVISSGTIAASNSIGTPDARLRFGNNGQMTVFGTSVVTDTVDRTLMWGRPSTTSGTAPISRNTWIRATLLSGGTPNTNAGLNTWLALTSSRDWGNTTSVVASLSSTILFELATDSTGANVVASGTITLAAERT